MSTTTPETETQTDEILNADERESLDKLRQSDNAELASIADRLLHAFSREETN